MQFPFFLSWEGVMPQASLLMATIVISACINHFAGVYHEHIQERETIRVANDWLRRQVRYSIHRSSSCFYTILTIENQPGPTALEYFAILMICATPSKQIVVLPPWL